MDVRETPVERITPNGIRTSYKEYYFDFIIYATGFDAITGPLTRIDIRDEKGKIIKEAWANGPSTNLGIQAAGFPNLFTATSSAFCNYPVCAEMVVEWIRDCIAYLRSKGYKRIVPTPEAEEEWIDHAAGLASHTFLTSTKSWFMRTNIPGKSLSCYSMRTQRRIIARSAQTWRRAVTRASTCNKRSSNRSSSKGCRRTRVNIRARGDVLQVCRG